MEAIQERLNKLREERLAREKARIEKLRELNLKKYNTDTKNNGPTQAANNSKPPLSAVKNSSVINGSTKRPMSAPGPKQQPINLMKNKTDTKITKSASVQGSSQQKDFTNNRKSIAPSNIAKLSKNISLQGPALPKDATKNKTVANTTSVQDISQQKACTNSRKSMIDKPSHIAKSNRNISLLVPSQLKATTKPNIVRKSIAPMSHNCVTEKTHPKSTANASMSHNCIPEKTRPKSTATTNVSVFERLYKPKMTQDAHSKTVEKLKTDPNYLKKVMNTTGLILNKRHTVFNTKPKVQVPVRRSISAVHLKHISKSELGNCIQSWGSIGDKLNKSHLKHINEDESVHKEVVSAIKSERKKVTFKTPSFNFNTPTQEDLQTRLKAWLQKRGKSLNLYPHLQCFGLCHLPRKSQFENRFDDDDENKENIAVESDSDDDSYSDVMNVENGDKDQAGMNNKWRSASIVSDSVDFNESQNTVTTCSDRNDSDELVIGALNNLTELLKEGYEWTQCARWLRAIRERFPSTLQTGAYWECRAALEETRGDLPASVQCWEEAIAKGTEQSVADASLDQLLDKFMQLKISPNSAKTAHPVNPKLVDVKNVFKSTIIRFAVQQAKLRKSIGCTDDSQSVPYSVTPVRRSSRLRLSRTPLQIASSLHQAQQLAPGPAHFTPNLRLHATP